ncbi:hypothetical protein T484DRAFT_1924939 [Baffinella frigidus]|nr:hypothetical protein T484DRAFT_1924939 [Cryptophyta sp. CCMP2293]
MKCARAPQPLGGRELYLQTLRDSRRCIYIFTYCLIRAGRSPRFAQLSLGGGTESLPATLRLVVQLLHVYTSGVDVIFLGTDQAQAVDSGVGPTFEGRNRPKDLDHLGASLW